MGATVARMATDNPSRGYCRIQGALHGTRSRVQVLRGYGARFAAAHRSEVKPETETEVLLALLEKLRQC